MITICRSPWTIPLASCTIITQLEAAHRAEKKKSHNQTVNKKRNKIHMLDTIWCYNRFWILNSQEGRRFTCGKIYIKRMVLVNCTPYAKFQSLPQCNKDVGSSWFLQEDLLVPVIWLFENQDYVSLGTMLRTSAYQLPILITAQHRWGPWWMVLFGVNSLCKFFCLVAALYSVCPSIIIVTAMMGHYSFGLMFFHASMLFIQGSSVQRDSTIPSQKCITTS